MLGMGVNFAYLIDGFPLVIIGSSFALLIALQKRPDQIGPVSTLLKSEDS
jgi:hypothetical protein